MCPFNSLHVADTATYVCKDTATRPRSYLVETGLVRVHICAMTRSYMCHDSFIYVPRLAHSTSYLVETGLVRVGHDSCRVETQIVTCRKSAADWRSPLAKITSQPARVMSHIPTSHVQHMNESSHARMDVSSHPCECVMAYCEGCMATAMSHVCMSHVIHVNESCHDRVSSHMSHIAHTSSVAHMSSVAHTKES